MKFTSNLINKYNTILLDGATGTELEKNGVLMDRVCWSGLAGSSHPKVLQSIHEQYILAGSKVITTNTFASARHNIESTNRSLKVEKINLQTINCALEARNKFKNLDIKIAGSMSLSFVDERYEYPESKSIGNFSHDELLENYREQTKFFIEKDLDLILLEMVSHPKTAKPMIQAALESGLPIWLGLCAGPKNENGQVLAYEAKNILLADVLKLITPEIESVIIMHSETEYIDDCLSEIQSQYSGFLGAYPHKGFFKKPNWFYDDKYTPEMFYNDMYNWINVYNLKIIGGCCGIGPKHIQLLHNKFIAS